MSGEDRPSRGFREFINRRRRELNERREVALLQNNNSNEQNASPRRPGNMIFINGPNRQVLTMRNSHTINGMYFYNF